MATTWRSSASIEGSIYKFSERCRPQDTNTYTTAGSRASRTFTMPRFALLNHHRQAHFDCCRPEAHLVIASLVMNFAGHQRRARGSIARDRELRLHVYLV